MHEFLDQLSSQVIRSSFFHNEPKQKINLLKLPIIMPSCLLGKMENTEIRKKSLMNCYHKYTSDVFTRFVKVVSTGQLNILGIEDLAKSSPDKLKQIAKGIGIRVKKKSNAVLVEELNSLAKVFLAGQGIVNLRLLLQNEGFWHNSDAPCFLLAILYFKVLVMVICKSEEGQEGCKTVIVHTYLKLVQRFRLYKKVSWTPAI